MKFHLKSTENSIEIIDAISCLIHQDYKIMKDNQQWMIIKDIIPL